MTATHDKGLTKEQIQWAMSHDWYIGHNWNPETGYGIVRVEERVVQMATRELGVAILVFSDFHKLRDWAGY